MCWPGLAVYEYSFTLAALDLQPPKLLQQLSYACFHAFSAVLFAYGRSFKKHREVRSILHRDFVREKKIEEMWGKHYDWLFDNRQKASRTPPKPSPPNSYSS
ncbi:MAG: hypothetical protein C0407_06000 [Desulfobacca sp.]|nr:hypothetical protein [Desulfobacca sp.]